MTNGDSLRWLPRPRIWSCSIGLLAWAFAAPMVTAEAAAARAVVPLSSTVLRVPPEVSVRGEEILLGDLGVFEGDDTLAARVRGLRLGPAPLPGGTVLLEGETVRYRLRLAQVDSARVQIVVPARILVTRASQVVTAAALIEAATREALNRLPAPAPGEDPHALVPIGRPNDLRVPTGELELTVRSQDPQIPSTFVASTVTIRVDGRDYQTIPLTFRVGRYQRVVVATKELEPKGVLNATDFRVESRASVDLPPQALREVDDPSDFEVTRPIKAGEVLTTYLLRPKLVVRRGETVTLLLEGRGFRIMTAGLAAEDARRGDPVRVLNISSKREVLGTAEKAGTVRVPFVELRSE